MLTAVLILETMPELFHASINRHRAQNAAAVAAVSDLPSVKLDEFVLGFRDCAKESLRYLEDTTVTTSDTETSGRSLVDALRGHLIEHEAQMMRRRRRRKSNNHDVLGRSAATAGCLEYLHSSRQPPRRRRRLHVTSVSAHEHRLRRFHECRYPVETQTVHSESSHDSDIPDSSWNMTCNTSDESGCGKDFSSERSRDVDDNAAVVAAGDEFARENMDELRQYASELSALADRDVRVGQLLAELFQLMDNDGDY